MLQGHEHKLQIGDLQVTVSSIGQQDEGHSQSHDATESGLIFSKGAAGHGSNTVGLLHSEYAAKEPKHKTVKIEVHSFFIVFLLYLIVLLAFKF